MSEEQAHKGSFRDRMRLAASILTGDMPEDRAHAGDAGGHLHVGRSQFDKIFSFLETVQLDPLPDNYRLAWEYLIGGNTQLRHAVDRKLDTNGRLSSEIVAEILEETDSQIKIRDLADLVREGQALLDTGQNTLARSGKDSAAYADALQTGLDGMKAHDASIETQFETLLKVTRQMVTSTKKARDSLQQSSDRISAMRGRLDEVTSQAQHDQLTGLPNRWAFEKQFAAATIRAKERFESLSVAFIDIDHFKQVNDTHGHEAGDRVLQLVAEHLDSFAKGNCHLARHGGEEFVIVFEGHSASEAKALIDTARETLAARTLVNRDTGTAIGTVTFSAGIAEYDPGQPSRQLLRNADSALYAAKHGGRNQARVFGTA